MAHLPACQEERQKSFITLVWIATLSIFCTAIGIFEVSCLVKCFLSSAFSSHCFKKGLNAPYVPLVITLECCAGEGGEAIFS